MRARQLRPYAVAVVAIIAAVAAIELWLGRVPMCTCGSIKLWHGVVQSAENSQHITDWYTFSHVIHGLGFYWLLWLVGRRWPIGVRLVAATLIEGAWEVVENTPLIIDRYRAATIALDYYGDSILNSTSDIAAMLLGFWIASRVPVWASIVIAVVVRAVRRHDDPRQPGAEHHHAALPDRGHQAVAGWRLAQSGSAIPTPFTGS